MKFKTLALLALLAVSGAASADVYVDGGLRNLTGTGHQVTGAVGADTAIGRSGFRAGAELSHSFGNTTYGTAAGVVSYEGSNWSPFAKLGKASGDVRGTYKAVGVEYRTSPQAGGWSGGVEYNKVSLDADAGSVNGMNVFARYRF